MQVLPLEGFAVGVTADRRAEEQCEMLRRRGAVVVHGPTVRTMPLAADGGIRAATEALVGRGPDVVIANTGIGIRGWFAAAESWGLGEALRRSVGRARILARGPKAAGAVLTAGLEVAWRAPSESLAAVVDEILRTEVVDGTRVAFQLDGAREQPEVRRLRDAGAQVIPIPVYSWALPTDDSSACRLVEAACTHRLDAVTFTSGAAVRNLFALAERRAQAEELRAALAGRVLPLCVGPICASVAAEHGVSGIQPPRARLGSMVHRLTEVLSARRRRLRTAGGVDLVVQGAAVVVGTESVQLTDRERAVFELLAERPGAVVTRADLRRSVWDGSADDHTLEVTVARLRRKLGVGGDAVCTVVRRGYRLDARSVDALSSG